MPMPKAWPVVASMLNDHLGISIFAKIDDCNSSRSKCKIHIEKSTGIKFYPVFQVVSPLAAQYVKGAWKTSVFVKLE
jgi:hypothetical protein